MPIVMSGFDNEHILGLARHYQIITLGNYQINH